MGKISPSPKSDRPDAEIQGEGGNVGKLGSRFYWKGRGRTSFKYSPQDHRQQGEGNCAKNRMQGLNRGKRRNKADQKYPMGGRQSKKFLEKRGNRPKPKESQYS